VTEYIRGIDMHLVLRFLISAVALYITVVVGSALGLHLYLEPGVKGVEGVCIAAVALGIVNSVIRPIIQLIALPITCLTLGLFSIVINAVLFLVVGQFIPGFHVNGFLAALFGTIVMGFVGTVLSSFVISDGDRDRSRSRSRA
jgi:putative membrane protein